MILVDSGVLIDFLRTKDPKLAVLFGSLPVAVCGATRAEILCGARSSADRQRLLVFLSPFQQVPIPDSLWDGLGDNLAALRASGVTVPLVDTLIATVGIENGIEVWARDPHFPAMQRILTRLRRHPALSLNRTAHWGAATRENNVGLRPRMPKVPLPTLLHGDDRRQTPKTTLRMAGPSMFMNNSG